MSLQSINNPFNFFTDSKGDALDAGYMYIGTAELNSITSPISIYWDVDLTIPAAQPIRTVGGYPSYLGSPGTLYVTDDNYSITVLNKKQELIYSNSNVNNNFLISDLSQAYEFATLNDAVVSTRLFPIGKTLHLQESVEGDGDNATWIVNLLSAVTVGEGVVASTGSPTLAFVRVITSKMGDLDYISTTAGRDAYYVGRTSNILSDIHGFTDRSVLGDVTDSGTYGSFDAVTKYNGSTKDYNHLHAFQDRNIFDGDGTLVALNGFYSKPLISGEGVVAGRNGIQIFDFDHVGGGSVTVNTAIRIRPMENGDNNFAFVSEGNIRSTHGGPMSFGFPTSFPSGDEGLRYGGFSLTGITQAGVLSNGGANSAATFRYAAFSALAQTSIDGVYNVAELSGLRVQPSQLAPSTTVSKNYGVHIEGQTIGATNYSINMETIAGANNWNIYQEGNAANWFSGASKFGGTVGQATAQAEFSSGAVGAGSAPIKLNGGSLMTTPESGAFEFDGTNLYFTVGGVRKTVTLT